ncbi:hypothetical protein [Tractidigestivibacter sp.]|uniref:hypothetical protein n=1 Tax=Tractidigestivibacter sp. TaxID=2847320 RepID=UPI003D8D537E
MFRMPAVIVQLARIWDEIDVATVAMEMLGTYGISNQEDFSWAVDLQPLVTMGELQDYARVASASGVRGAKRAQEAIKLSVPNSNSPRETAVALYLGLPRRKGWAELGGFVMNQGIRLAEEQERIAGQGVVKPDFLWESKSVSVEYDSDLEHLTPQQKTKDERRRNAMESAGYWAPTLTNGIVKDEDALNAFTAELERRMGFRRRALTRAESERRHDLVRRLFVKDF